MDDGKMIKPLLNPEQIAEVSLAVENAERGTSGEIVPVILERSDVYAGARWRMSVVLALTTGFILAVFFPQLHPIWIVWAQVPALFLGYLLGSIALFQRTVLAADEMDEEVKQRALEIFHLHKLHATRDRTGVLIFVSLLEHRVLVLADSGINSKVPSGTWDALVQKLIAQLKEGRTVDGLVAAIAECGSVLREHFPARDGDSNELPNRPILTT